MTPDTRTAETRTPEIKVFGDSWAQPPGPSVLGEGPVWSIAEQCLYWVDIQGMLVHRWQWGTQEIQTWPMPSMVGAVAIRAQGGLVVALRTGIHTLDLTTGELEFIADPEEDVPGTRYNDGTADRAGRFWIGGMVLDGEPGSAGLHRIETDGSHTTVLTGIGCSNGAGFSPDGSLMYYTDTVSGKIVVFDFDVASGNVSNPRDFAVDDDGEPDGLTVDSEGFLWSAKWGGGRIVRYAPDGSIDREITLPVPRPTSIAFGGPDLRTVFVTTARSEMSAEEIAAKPLSGQLLLIDDVGVAGQPEATTRL